MGRSRYKFAENDYPYFLTCTILNWTALFGKSEVVRIILDSLRFMVDHERMTINGWVIMENHLHLIASSENLSKQLHDFKSYTARCIVNFLTRNRHVLLLEQFRSLKKEHKVRQNYQIWEEGSHPELIANMNMFKQKLDYIHFNPVRRGYVSEPDHWMYTSYNDYHGGTGLLTVTIIGL